MVWKVMPMSKGQLLDIAPKDLLCEGTFRLCETYKGGGGYDRFPYIASRKLGGHPDAYSIQFIVQLKGCNLDCPYCYVTRAGIWGEHVNKTSNELVDAFIESGAQVFHLMGGAPALQLQQWPELIGILFKKCPNAIFHSDFMLTEKTHYRSENLRDLNGHRCLYAINIKGLTQKAWLSNTRKPLDEAVFWANWLAIQKSGVSAYVTFTGVLRSDLDTFWQKAEKNSIDVNLWAKESFVIDLIEYEAVKHVDDIAWGTK